ncbi:MAG: AzlC family ABC transporter permease [Alcaligenaceae bacterium]|nr:AzlC family ABC transporter permease [Alcaligenaceae bacterium]
MSAAFFKGLAASLSIAVGYVPVAVSFGLAAIYAGFSAPMAVLVSVLVYAGASQFILVTLVAGGGTIAGVVGIVFLMNLRHLFYGPALAPRLGGKSRRLPALALAWGLTDEVFATAVSALDRQAERDREAWYMGLQLGAYASWVGGTAAGAFFGQDWIKDSDILMQTLGFVLPALFFALLLEIKPLVSAGVLWAAGVAAGLALLVLPAYGAIVAGMLAGVLYALRRA